MESFRIAVNCQVGYLEPDQILKSHGAFVVIHINDSVGESEMHSANPTIAGLPACDERLCVEKGCLVY